MNLGINYNNMYDMGTICKPIIFVSNVSDLIVHITQERNHSVANWGKVETMLEKSKYTETILWCLGRNYKQNNGTFMQLSTVLGSVPY